MYTYHTAWRLSCGTYGHCQLIASGVVQFSPMCLLVCLFVCLLAFAPFATGTGSLQGSDCTPYMASRPSVARCALVHLRVPGTLHAERYEAIAHRRQPEDSPLAFEGACGATQASTRNKCDSRQHSFWGMLLVGGQPYSKLGSKPSSCATAAFVKDGFAGHIQFKFQACKDVQVRVRVPRARVDLGRPSGGGRAGKRVSARRAIHCRL
jgi:hypothetical protein